MKTIKPHFKTFQYFYLGRTLFAAVAALVLWTGLITASGREPVPASVLSKLDKDLVLVVMKSRGEAPFDTATTLEPDVYQRRGRVLVEIQGSISRELSNQLTSFGGELVIGWGTATNFRAWVPFAQLETLAGRADIKSISAARPSVTRRLSPR